MSQNDLVIANQAFPATRADITSALQALGSNNSGPNTPSTTYANMMWYDTTSNILKIRAEANDAWINIGYLDQSLDTFKILDDTIVATTAGATTGLLGDQSTATWTTGTGTTESLVSPAKVKAAVGAFATPSLTLGTFTAASGNIYLDFSVPTTATEIYVNYYDVIPTGGVEVLMKVSGSPVTSGYYSSSGTSGAESGKTTSFYMYCINGRNLTGVMSITKASSTVWMETHASTQNLAENNGAGRFINAGPVDGIRFQAGTIFSGGQVSVSYR
jgi:hypothetical protein